jgi:hypothetical protein
VKQVPAQPTGAIDLDAIRDAFAGALRDQGISFETAFDAFRIDNKQLYVRPVRLDQRHFRFDAFIAMDERRVLEPVSSYIMEDEEPGSNAAQRACDDWIRACLEPLGRTVTFGAEPDTTFNLYVERELRDPDRQVLFDVFAGPYLVHGDSSDKWGRRFLHSLIDWLIANGELRVPDRPFNLLRIGKHINASGKETGLCMINRNKWDEADGVLTNLEWPGAGEQQLLNYIGLRRINVPQTSDS